MADARREDGRRSIRLPNFDYSSAGWHFVTICTHARRCTLGSVVDGSVVLSRAGSVVEKEWVRSLGLREGLAFDLWVIMPNHLHAIVVLPVIERGSDVTRAHSCAPLKRRPRSLSSLVAQFKASATRTLKEARLLASGKAWQRGFYDHIIRSQCALDALREYIHYNPLKWQLDKYNPDVKGTDSLDESELIADADRQPPDS